MSEPRSASVSPGAACPVATVAASLRPSTAPEMVQGASTGTMKTVKMSSLRRWEPGGPGKPTPCAVLHFTKIERVAERTPRSPQARPPSAVLRLVLRTHGPIVGRPISTAGVLWINRGVRGRAGSRGLYSTFILRPAGMMRRGPASSRALSALLPSSSLEGTDSRRAMRFTAMSRMGPAS
ncbi:hypothetical protein FKP32DRAFT_1467464 [Trametes sanguinea]|nr:hypothetical protein FKP32DRAFT_1467464 [Trametes sanguinea]